MCRTYHKHPITMHCSVDVPWEHPCSGVKVKQSRPHQAPPTGCQCSKEQSRTMKSAAWHWSQNQIKVLILIIFQRSGLRWSPSEVYSGLMSPRTSSSEQLLQLSFKRWPGFLGVCPTAQELISVIIMTTVTVFTAIVICITISRIRCSSSRRRRRSTWHLNDEIPLSVMGRA